MSDIFEIPLSGASQTFQIPLGGSTYTFRVVWRNAIEKWTLDIADEKGERRIISGIPLLPGTDLLGAYQYLGFGFGLRLRCEPDPDAMPTYENLGTACRLYAVMA